MSSSRLRLFSVVSVSAISACSASANLDAGPGGADAEVEAAVDLGPTDLGPDAPLCSGDFSDPQSVAASVDCTFLTTFRAGGACGIADGSLYVLRDDGTSGPLDVYVQNVVPGTQVVVLTPSGAGCTCSAAVELTAPGFSLAGGLPTDGSIVGILTTQRPSSVPIDVAVCRRSEGPPRPYDAGA